MEAEYTHLRTIRLDGVDIEWKSEMKYREITLDENFFRKYYWKQQWGRLRPLHGMQKGTWGCLPPQGTELDVHYDSEINHHTWGGCMVEENGTIHRQNDT